VQSLHPKTFSAQATVAVLFALIGLNSGPHLFAIPLKQPATFQNPQTETPPIFRLFRMEGTYGEELTAKTNSGDKQRSPGFSLVNARLENDGMGALARLRATLTIANEDSRRITEVEWRLDIFDASIGNANRSVIQSEKRNIYSGETANVSAKFGAVLPDRMVILLQVTRVSFAEGPSWSASKDCSLEADLRTVSCGSK